MEQESGTRRPRVVVSVSMSVDAKVTLGRDRLLMDADASRVWRSLQPSSAPMVEETRSSLIAGLHRPEAILEGSGTFVTDSTGPLSGLPTQIDDADMLRTDFLPEDVLARPGPRKWFTVVDSRGRVQWTKQDDGEFDLLVLVARATPAGYLAYLRRERVCYLVAGEERVDLAAALQRMRDRLAVTCVLSTAGGGLNGALLRAGLIDEIHLLVLPAAIGGHGTPTLFDGPELGADESPTRLRLITTHAESDGTVWLRYEVLHGPAPTA